VTPEARPYVAPVWYAYDPAQGRFFVVGRERSRFVGHIRATPHVALQIADDAHLAHTRVLVEGRAELTLGPVAPAAMPDLRALVDDMARRYLGPDGPRYAAHTLDRPRYLITITPVRWQSWTGGEWAGRYLA
jgi:hypothetical protein